MALAACGRPPFVGVYSIDTAAMEQSMKAQAPKEAREGGPEALAKMAAGMAAAMRGTLDLKADGTVAIAVTMPMMGDKQDVGTWRQDGEAIVITTSEKKELRATLNGAQLTCRQAGGDDRFVMIFRRN